MKTNPTLIYYDAYTRHRFEGLKSTDLKTWESIKDQLSFPKGIRHGMAFAVSPESAKALN